MSLYSFCRSVVKGVLKLLFRIKVTGLENEPMEGAVILCPNHISLWDPVFIACAMKVPLRFMAKKELFDKPVLGWFLNTIGAYPVSRDANDIGAVKHTLRILKEGGHIGIFPQGKRFRGVAPRSTQIKGGAGMMAMHTKAAVLPIGIYTKDYKVRIFRKVLVRVGEPIPYAVFEPLPKNGEGFEQATGIIFDEICRLAVPKAE